MYTLIVPLTKSPEPIRGRIGKKEHQDWYRSCSKAANLVRTTKHTKILLITNFRAPGCRSDLGAYASTLIQLGVSRHDIIPIQEESETIGQVQHAESFARERNTKLIFIASLLHAPRVWWLMHSMHNAQLVVTYGIPRPKEAFTDIVLIFLFPLIDLFGKRKWFQELTSNRRDSGKL